LLVHDLTDLRLGHALGVNHRKQVLEFVVGVGLSVTDENDLLAV